ncbi:sel1 repeat family protein [Clostridium tertium]|uniref:Beta-lactamase HcpC n=1 Tax=Clostridium tertium TaxID=1559 RepID=A0A6N3GTM4_9CLOT
MKYSYDFLLLEFKDVYYIINKVFEEEEIRAVNSNLVKFIKEIIIKAHLNNKIFYNSENSFSKNLEILYKKNIIPYDLMRYISSYIEDLYYYKKILNAKIKEAMDYREKIINEDIIYNACVWLAVSSGEEDYSLFINNLNNDEKIVFNKYLNNNDGNFKYDYIDDEESEADINTEDISKEDIEDRESKDGLSFLDFDDIEDNPLEDSLEDEEISSEEYLLTGELYYLGKNVDKDYNKAKEYFEKAAKEGNEHAESYLGLFYEKGYGGEKNMEKALYWYKKAALKGNIFSQYSLGYIYYEGKDVEKNSQYSFKWYMEAAESGFAPAQYALSYLYKNGEGCEKSNFKAYYWLEESADNDFEDSFYILGQSYLEGKEIELDYKKAYLYFSKGASKKDKNCLEGLGDMYYWGLYVKEDKKKAFEFYNESIVEGNGGLYYKLGNLYEESNDIKMALMNYYKGCANGDLKSVQRLGIMYYYGEGVREDKDKGFEYLSIAADSEDPHSLYLIGNAYLEEDKEEGLEYLKSAYRKGSVYAAEALVNEGMKNFLNNEEYKELDILSYVNKILDGNLNSGYYYYALLFHYGIGVEKNDETAFMNMLKGAKRGCREAMEKLIEWYTEGIFVNKNIDLADKWSRKLFE